MKMKSVGLCLFLTIATISCHENDNLQRDSRSADERTVANTVRTIRPDFIYVQDGHLAVNGQPYVIYNSNSYRMLESRASVDQALAACQRLGLNALRMFGFANGEAPGNPNDALLYNWTPGSGGFNRDGGGRDNYALDDRGAKWQQLDYAIARAHDYHIRLIIPINNYWDEGIWMIARWAGEYPIRNRYDTYEGFYTNPKARAIYTTLVRTLMEHVNSITGVKYKDDPTILMWEPLNEPRGRSDMSGNKVHNWLAFAADTIKRYDPDHLVGSGTEGFLRDYPTNPFDGFAGFNYNQPAFHLNSSNALRHRLDPVKHQLEYETMAPEGVFFPEDCMAASIDLCSLHAWPYNWFADEYDGSGRPVFVAAFMRAHREIMNRIGLKKPLYLGEFGRQIPREQTNYFQHRDQIYELAYQEAIRSNFAGIGYWHLGFGNPGGYYLAFDVVCDPYNWQNRDATCDIIKKYTTAAQAAYPYAFQGWDLTQPGTNHSTPPPPVIDHPPVPTSPPPAAGPCANRICPRDIDTSRKQLCNPSDTRWYCVNNNGCWCVIM